MRKFISDCFLPPFKYYGGYFVVQIISVPFFFSYLKYRLFLLLEPGLSKRGGVERNATNQLEFSTEKMLCFDEFV